MEALPRRFGQSGWTAGKSGRGKLAQ